MMELKEISKLYWHLEKDALQVEGCIEHCWTSMLASASLAF